MPCGVRCKSLSFAVCDIGADSVESADSTESGGPNALSLRPIIYLIDRVYIHKMKRSPRRSEKSPMKM